MASALRIGVDLGGVVADFMSGWVLRELARRRPMPSCGQVDSC